MFHHLNPLVQRFRRVALNRLGPMNFAGMLCFRARSRIFASAMSLRTTTTWPGISPRSHASIIASQFVPLPDPSTPMRNPLLLTPVF